MNRSYFHWMNILPTWWGWAFGGHSTLSTWLVNVWQFNSDATDVIWWNNWTVFGATNTTWFNGNGYNFDWINDYISITSLSSSVKSFSAWAKKSSTGAYWRIMWASWWTYYLVQLYNDWKNYTRILSWQTLSFAQTDDTNWHHYVITASWTTVKIYVDWVLKLSQASTWNFANLNQIGKYTTINSWPNLWIWDIDEIYTWDKVLSDGWVSVGATATWEVADLYASWAWLFY